MGGNGSGGYRWGQRRIAVEGCFALDVNWFARHDVFTSTGRLRFHWDQAVVGAAAFNAESFELVLVFQTDDNRLVDQRVRITCAPCSYRGSRFWFECPSCAKRVAKLYLPRCVVSELPSALRFACRGCWALSYQLRNIKNPYEIAVRRAGRIKERLGAARSPLSRLPLKPKRMRWRTYYRHVEKFSLTMKRANEALISDFAKHFPEIFVEITRATGGPQSNGGIS